MLAGLSSPAVRPRVITPADFAEWEAGEPLRVLVGKDAGCDVLSTGELVELYSLDDGSRLAVVHCPAITPEIGMNAGDLLNALRSRNEPPQP